jgi:hypothetical protein
MSFSLKSSVDLPNSPVPGAHIPLIGLGTYAGSSGGLAPAVKYAVKEAGYRHIDAAYAYFNEKGKASLSIMLGARIDATDRGGRGDQGLGRP